MITFEEIALSDSRIGGFCSSLMATTSTSLHSTSNMPGKKILPRIGTRVCSLPWSCGMSMTPAFMFLMVIQSNRIPDPVSNLTQFLVATHRFNAEEGDWGFTRFFDLRRLFTHQFEGKSTTLVHNDEAYVTAYVRVVKDPTGVLWHSLQKYILPCSVCLDTQLIDSAQLRLQERDRDGRVEKSRCHLLPELSPSVPVFHECF